MTSSGLIRLSRQFSLESDWAESWEPLEDADGWRFHLRADNEGWGNGLPVTAHDFATRWINLLMPESDPNDAALLYDVENALEYRRGEASAEEVGIVALDDTTLEVYLNRQRETFPIVTTSPALRPTWPQSLGDGEPVCQSNGRFRIDEQDEERLRLAPGMGHWEFEEAQLEHIELTHFSPGLALAEFRQGSLDIIRLTNTDVARVREDLELSDALERAMPARVIMLIPNIEIPPFDSAEVRRAISQVIDRRRLEQIVEGRVIPAARLFPTGMFPSFDDAAAGIAAELNVDAALEELANSPYPDPDEWPSFGLDIPSGDGYLDRVARDVANQIRENLGAQVPIRVHDPDEFELGLRERRYPLAWFDWTYPYADPASTFTDLFAGWRDPESAISWSHPEYDELVWTADTLMSDGARASAYAGCEGLLQEHGACIPLVHPQDFYLVQPWLDGLPFDGRGRLITGETLGLDLTRELVVLERPE
jgi:oligopeptide transport system substrate-binding protein